MPTAPIWNQGNVGFEFICNRLARTEQLLKNQLPLGPMMENDNTDPPMEKPSAQTGLLQRRAVACFKTERSKVQHCTADIMGTDKVTDVLYFMSSSPGSADTAEG